MDDQHLALRFPRSSKYNPGWIVENGFGGNPLWQTEWLCERLSLSPGMRVLDLGCGRAKSSIFLAREFGVEVWATDLWVAASENWQRVRDCGLERKVFPIHADARGLPFAAEFFDAILAVDSYSYFGTDSLYLNYWAQFVKAEGQIGIAGAGLVTDWDGAVPEHLKSFWSQDCWALSSVDAWRRLWERTGIVDIETADAMEEGWRYWSCWHRRNWPDNVAEIAAIEEDAGRYLGYVRTVGRRRPGVELAEYAWPDALRSWPKAYEKKCLLRTDLAAADKTA
jgi:cyclopropane fatty-acyl-phospholipid synthase-like methyltransferase